MAAETVERNEEKPSYRVGNAVISSPTDNREYRVIYLSNGLRAILVSDPLTVMAAIIVVCANLTEYECCSCMKETLYLYIATFIFRLRAWSTLHLMQEAEANDFLKQQETSANPDYRPEHRHHNMENETDEEDSEDDEEALPEGSTKLAAAALCVSVG